MQRAAHARARKRRRFRVTFAVAAGYVALLRTGADFLGAVRDILCVRLQH
jgi:hypothetical protein